MMNKSSSRLFAWLLALVMVFNISPIAALADPGTVEPEEYIAPTDIQYQSARLYNYITFDEKNRSTYYSLNLQDTGFEVIGTASDLITKDPKKQTYALQDDEYHVDGDYPFSGLKFVENSINYVHESARTNETQPYYKTELYNVEAVNAAHWRNSGGKLKPDCFVQRDQSHYGSVGETSECGFSENDKAYS